MRLKNTVFNYACVTFLVTVMQSKGSTVDSLEVVKP